MLLIGVPRTASAQWSTAANGNDVYKTNTAGNVGIGTASPGSKLTVVSGSGYVYFLNDTTGLGSLWGFGGVNGSNLAIAAYTPASGNLISRLGINYAVHSGNGSTQYAIQGTKHAPLIELNAQDGSLSLFGEDGSGADYRTPTLNLGVYVRGNGNVGIGTTTPTNRLHVVGAYDGDGVRLVGSTSGPIDPAYSLYDGPTARGSLGLAEAATAFSGSASPGDIVLRADTGKLHLQTGTGAASLTISSGNVGVGTTTPVYRLDVNGEINATGLRINGTPISTGGSSQWTGTGNISYSGGNVGIGTASPKASLEVNGRVWVTSDNNTLTSSGVGTALQYFSTLGRGGIGVFDYANNVYKDLQIKAATTLFHTGDTEVMRITSAGNVGIGTTSPEAKLSVGTAPTGGHTPNIAVFNLSADSQNGVIVRRGGVTNPQELNFGVNQSSLYSEIQAVQNNVAANSLVLNGSGGNVGIGTTTPGYLLDVAGNINSRATITGNNIVAKYQDVAEWVPSSEQVNAGTVVVLDTTKSNQVISSTVSYDTRVAGVVSMQPGIALGESGAGKVLVATTGRVLVKVDASHGPINIGDLLVTSDIPGVAMKSEPVKVGNRMMHLPGTLIGKALEPLEKGSGKILVLLSLQ
jgi:hypothetical protein